MPVTRHKKMKKKKKSIEFNYRLIFFLFSNSNFACNGLCEKKKKKLTFFNFLIVLLSEMIW
jgi:hypothetical protein